MHSKVLIQFRSSLTFCYSMHLDEFYLKAHKIKILILEREVEFKGS